jgi:hypothetical protein
MRLATELAAIRLGWVCPIKRGRCPGAAAARPMAKAILGNWVVLPEPVSPHTMMTWCARRVCSISWRLADTGKDSGKSI